MKVALQLHRAYSLKPGSCCWGQEEGVFGNTGHPSFGPTLEGCRSWLAQRPSQAESWVRVVTWPWSHLSEDAVIKQASFPCKEMSWRFGRLRAGLGSATHGQGPGLGRGLFCLPTGVWFLQAKLHAWWVYWPAWVQLLAAITGSSDLALWLIFLCMLWGDLKNKIIFQ